LASEQDEEQRPQASSPRSALRIFGLLEALGRHGEGVSLAQLSNELSSPKSSLLMLLRPIVAEGYLVRAEGRYILGPRMYRLAAELLNTRRYPRAVRPYLEALAERTRETVYLAVLDREMKLATFIDMIESPRTIKFDLPLGFTRPLYATAAGRLLLAFQEPAWQHDYLHSTDLKPLTTYTTTEPETIQRDLTAIRRLKVAISIDEAVDGGGAIAAPIMGPGGEVEAALVVAAPTTRLRKNLSSYQHAVVELAAEASGASVPHGHLDDVEAEV